MAGKKSASDRNKAWLTAFANGIYSDEKLSEFTQQRCHLSSADEKRALDWTLKRTLEEAGLQFFYLQPGLQKFPETLASLRNLEKHLSKLIVAFLPPEMSASEKFPSGTLTSSSVLPPITPEVESQLLWAAQQSVEQGATVPDMPEKFRGFPFQGRKILDSLVDNLLRLHSIVSISIENFSEYKKDIEDSQEKAETKPTVHVLENYFCKLVNLFEDYTGKKFTHNPHRDDSQGGRVIGTSDGDRFVQAALDPVNALLPLEYQVTDNNINTALRYIVKKRKQLQNPHQR